VHILWDHIHDFQTVLLHETADGLQGEIEYVFVIDLVIGCFFENVAKIRIFKDQDAVRL